MNRKEHVAIDVDYARNPAKTDIYSYGEKIRVELGALPRTINFEADTDSIYSQLSDYMREVTKGMDIHTVKSLHDKMWEFGSNATKEIEEKNKEIGLEIDKVCKTFETYIKGMVMKIAKEQQDIIEANKQKIKELVQTEVQQ